MRVTSPAPEEKWERGSCAVPAAAVPELAHPKRAEWNETGRHASSHIFRETIMRLARPTPGADRKHK
jgi:hypothetical protein